MLVKLDFNMVNLDFNMVRLDFNMVELKLNILFWSSWILIWSSWILLDFLEFVNGPIMIKLMLFHYYVVKLEFSYGQYGPFTFYEILCKSS